MSISMALSSEIFIDDILKKSFILKEKRLDLIGRIIWRWFLFSATKAALERNLLRTAKKGHRMYLFRKKWQRRRNQAKKTRELISEQLGISNGQIAKYEKVEKNGSSELKEKFGENENSVAVAEIVASLPAREQKDFHYLEWMEKEVTEDPERVGTRIYLLTPKYKYLYNCRLNGTAEMKHLQQSKT